jgi:hypothetical protein
LYLDCKIFTISVRRFKRKQYHKRESEPKEKPNPRFSFYASKNQESPEEKRHGKRCESFEEKENVFHCSILFKMISYSLSHGLGSALTATREFDTLP